MSKIAILCSGQGSQYVGMGLDFLEKFPELQVYFDEASAVLGEDVKTILLDEAKINQTLYTQPLMVLTSTIIHHLVEKMGIKKDAVAGFSLGEFSAMHIAKVFDFKDMMKIITYRAQVMQEASTKYPGKMAAILGLDHKFVEDICRETSLYDNIVVPVNYNSSNQLVISGAPDAVEKACEKLKAAGAKRALILNVSGAFHSPYMQHAGLQLKQFTKAFKYQPPTVKFYLNTSANAYSNQNLYDEMEKQIQSPVRFMQMIEQMIKDGITHFIEVGPGSVLAGLVRKIDANVAVYHVSKVEDLEKLKEIQSC